MDISLRASEHTYDFDRPIAEAALWHFDPELHLVWNNRLNVFQVHREIFRTRRYWIDGVGNVSFIEPVLYWVTDWDDVGLRRRDDPYTLIKHLWESDIKRVPDLLEDRVAMVDAHRERMERKVRDEWRHRFRDSKRQLMRAWEPFFNFPKFVR